VHGDALFHTAAQHRQKTIARPIYLRSVRRWMLVLVLAALAHMVPMVWP
jgi:hypothetical protein